MPAIVATLGTLSIYRGIDYVIASGKQVTINELPPGYGSLASATFAGIPIFVWVAVVIVTVVALLLHQTRFGRQVYAVGSNPEAATILGIRSRLVVFSVFAACGLLAGVGGVMWGIYFGAIEASAASGVSSRSSRACVVGV